MSWMVLIRGELLRLYDEALGARWGAGEGGEKARGPGRRIETLAGSESQNQNLFITICMSGVTHLDGNEEKTRSGVGGTVLFQLLWNLVTQDLDIPCSLKF